MSEYKARGKAFTSETAREANAKRKNKVGGKTFSMEANCTASEDTISTAINNTMYWFDRGRVQTDEECLDRIVEFFDRCASNGELPTVEKLCVALGVTRKTVWEWGNGSKGAYRATLISQAKEALAAIDSDLVQQGKIPAVPWIFRAKNFYNMTDIQQVQVETYNALGENADIRKMEQKYIESLPDVPLIE